MSELLFQLHSSFAPTGDQPGAIDELVANLHAGIRDQVLLGVTGCIAAYKSCEILRGLQKAGVRVKVVMTKNACEFVGQTTFRA